MGLDYNSLIGAFKALGNPSTIKTPVTNVPAKQFFANYMDSPMYKKRLTDMGVSDAPDVKNLLNTNISQVNGPGSVAYANSEWPGLSSKQAGFPVKPGVSNINIDLGRPEQDSIKKKYGTNNIPDHIVAHELSHVSRQLSPQEESLIGSLNKKEDEAAVWNRYTKNGGDDSFANFLNKNKPNAHDARPSEIKADLDALRYSLYKKGIYDTSKRDMTLDDFNKASKDPEIKNSLEYKRLTERFKPEHLILLNNSIASAHAPIEVPAYNPAAAMFGANGLQNSVGLPKMG